MDQLDRHLLLAIDEGKTRIAQEASQLFGVSRQTAAARLRRMAKAGVIEATGAGRARRYRLKPLVAKKWNFQRAGLDEFRVWEEAISPHLADLSENVKDIWRYGVTEMVNNAIDHSEGTTITVIFGRNAIRSSIIIQDDGEGIFHRIQRLLGLYDPRESILELAKGKLTTDPDRHSGEGVFFTSRVFDSFNIVSRTLVFAHFSEKNDWLIEDDNDTPGTRVFMEIENESERSLKAIFDEFAEPDEYSFSKTIVPVRLAHHEGEKLVSRSQAKRLVARFEHFRTVILDFNRVEEIGQAFADEIFRVFANSHPTVELIPVNLSDVVRSMITRVKSGSTLEVTHNLLQGR